MNKTAEIVFISIAFAVVGIRLYQKYLKKNQDKQDTGKKSDSYFTSSQKDDDYEPYLKK